MSSSSKNSDKMNIWKHHEFQKFHYKNYLLLLKTFYNTLILILFYHIFSNAILFELMLLSSRAYIYYFQPDKTWLPKQNQMLPTRVCSYLKVCNNTELVWWINSVMTDLKASASCIGYQLVFQVLHLIQLFAYGLEWQQRMAQSLAPPHQSRRPGRSSWLQISSAPATLIF